MLNKKLLNSSKNLFLLFPIARDLEGNHAKIRVGISNQGLYLSYNCKGILYMIRLAYADPIGLARSSCRQTPNTEFISTLLGATSADHLPPH